MFNSSWDEGVGSGPNPAANGYGGIPYSMHDMVKVPAVMGRYTLSWRWDCECASPPSAPKEGPTLSTLSTLPGP